MKKIIFCLLISVCFLGIERVKSQVVIDPPYVQTLTFEVDEGAHYVYNITFDLYTESAVVKGFVGIVRDGSPVSVDIPSVMNIKDIRIKVSGQNSGLSNVSFGWKQFPNGSSVWSGYVVNDPYYNTFLRVGYENIGNNHKYTLRTDFGTGRSLMPNF